MCEKCKEQGVEFWEPECGKLPHLGMPYEGGCGKKFTDEEYSNDMYRCADCNAFFHRDCIRKHFAQESIEDVMKELEKWKPAVIEMCEKANLNTDQGKQLIGYIYNYIDERVKQKIDETYRELHFKVGALPHDPSVVHPEWRDEVLKILDVENFRKQTGCPESRQD